MSDELIPIPTAHDTDVVKKPARRLATLDDLTRRNVTVVLQIGKVDSGEREEDGTPIMRPVEVELPLRTLSYLRVQKINASVPNPNPPEDNPTKDANGNLKRQFNYNDETYLRLMQEAMNERMYRMILEAWRQDVLALPGDNDDERLHYLMDEFDVATIRQLMDVLTTLGSEGRARIEARAETFHNGGTGNAAGNGTNGHSDKGGVG